MKNSHGDCRDVSKKDVTIVILAGGKGRRMGGRDKGLVTYQQKPLIKHVIDAAKSQSDNIIINANRNRSSYETFGYPVFADTLADYQGPLAGFLTAMTVVKSTVLVTLPCDGPVLVDNFLSRMIKRYNQADSDLVVAHDGDRIQPLYALIPTKLSDSLQQFLNKGGRKIDQWYRLHDTGFVDFSDSPEIFTNINSLQDLAVHRS